MRSHLAHSTLLSASICVFADGVTLVLRCVRLQLGPLLEHTAPWKSARGLTLKIDKCVVIALVVDIQEYTGFVAREPRAAGMRVARSAAYLGVEVGPGAIDTQWASVSSKMAARAPDIAAAPSMFGRLDLLSS